MQTKKAFKENQTGLIKKDKNTFLDIPQYIKTEAFLENIGFFTPSSKRIKGIYSKEKKIGEKIDKDGIKYDIKTNVSANHELGLPITSDLDYYRAFLKICNEVVDHDGRFNLPIAIPTSKLLRYAGKTKSAPEWREVKQWLARMTGTLIKGGLYRAKAKDFEEGFIGNVFSQVLLKGEKKKSGKTAETNYVWPSPWFLSNYYYRYVKTIDFNFHRRLRKPIAKALYTVLETGWYASGGNMYKKSYQNLCKDFLLTTHKHISDIKRQLDPAHKELVRESYLAKWEYTKSKSKPDYIITWYPGDKYFKDQQARDERKLTAQNIATGHKKLPEPNSLDDKQVYMVDEILNVCGDQENRIAYEKAVRENPENLIWTVISETKLASHERRIRKSRGAYFMDTLKRIAEMRANAR